MKAIVTLTVTLDIDSAKYYESVTNGDGIINEVSDLEDHINKFEHTCDIPEIDEVITEP